MTKFIYSLFIFSLVIISCKQSEPNTSQATSKERVNESVKQNDSEMTSLNLPSIDSNVFRKMAEKCDYIDYIFYELPISISQDNRQAIVSNINFVSRESVGEFSTDCKPMGRKFFHINGEIVLEADVYLDKLNGCFFYVFLENGKPTSANKISKDGINFYFNVFGQAGINK